MAMRGDLVYWPELSAADKSVQVRWGSKGWIRRLTWDSRESYTGKISLCSVSHCHSYRMNAQEYQACEGPNYIEWGMQRNSMEPGTQAATSTWSSHNFRSLTRCRFGWSFDYGGWWCESVKESVMVGNLLNIVCLPVFAICRHLKCNLQSTWLSSKQLRFLPNISGAFTCINECYCLIMRIHASLEGNNEEYFRGQR